MSISYRKHGANTRPVWNVNEPDANLIRRALTARVRI
jgi:hypothetical protein